jgi:DNA-binding transcriptional LysR family regulator
MNPPTTRQIQVYEAVVRLGSQAAAALELGMPTGAVSSAITQYRLKTGAPHPNPERARPRGEHRVSLTLREAAGQLPDRLDAVEARVGELTAAVDALGRLAGELAHEVRGFVGKQPIILEVRPTYRRQADGGLGPRGEEAAVRRAVG